MSLAQAALSHKKNQAAAAEVSLLTCCKALPCSLLQLCHYGVIVSVSGLAALVALKAFFFFFIHLALILDSRYCVSVFAFLT